MPFDNERKLPPEIERTAREREVPIGIAFARALAKSYVGPCKDEHCPMKEDETWKPGLCMVDGCPRRIVPALAD